MSNWFKLTVRQAHHFQIPWEIAAAPENLFYSTSLLDNLYDADPWLLLAFRRRPERPFVTTFQPCTVKRAFIHEVDGFNPLQEPAGGALLLSRQELSGLVRLLTRTAQEMSPRRPQTSATFELLDTDAWASFHVTPPPALAARQLVFLQIADPLADLREETAVSLIILTLPPVGVIHRGYHRPAPPRFELKLRQFPLTALQDPAFSPLQDAVSRIDLDRSGLFDLAMLLASQQAEFERNSFWATPGAAAADPIDNIFANPAAYPDQSAAAYCLQW